MATSLSLISLNCEGSKHLDLIFPFLKARQPDVICLQEFFARDIPQFEDQLGVKVAFAPFCNVVTANQYGIEPAGLWGVALLTRLPIPNITANYYVGTANQIPEFVDGHPNSVNRAVLSGVITKDEQTYQIATTHFTWTPDGKTNDQQRTDLPKLVSALDELDEFVLCGDLNAPRGEEAFAHLSQKYTDQVPPEVRTTIDGERHYAGNLEVVVDALLTTRAYTAKKVGVVSGVSDHCAIVGEIIKVT